MRVINRYRLRDYWNDHPRSEQPLRSWYQLVSSYNWDGPESLQTTFPYAQIHENLTAFDIHGSSYFVVTSIDYQRCHIYIREVLVHTDFRTGEWEQLAGRSEVDLESTDRDYMDLVNTFPLRPLKDDDLLRQAGARIDAVLGKANRSRDEQDYLDVLSLIVEDYERQHVSIPPVSGAAVLRTLVSEHRLSQAELIPLLGSKAKVTPVLKGTRPLDLRQVTRASRYFKLPPEVFVDPDNLEEVVEADRRPGN